MPNPFPGGYWGRVLRIDLSQGTVKVEELERGVLEDYVGGSGLGARLLYDETLPGTDPYSAENLLIFLPGPLTGTKTPCAGRHTLVSKSPLTGLLGESTSGGYFGAELKFAGFDAVAVKGIAPKPTYLWITENGGELKDAGPLWGKDTSETEDIITSDLAEPKAKVACIGVAGENKVRFAGVANDKEDFAGRTGLGAVMGAKGLKAVAVRGARGVEVAQPEALDELAKEMTKILVERPGMVSFGKYGTASVVNILNELGMLPTRNFAEGRFEEAEKISGETMAKTILTGRSTCYRCPIACGREIEVKSGPYAGLKGEGPEYETLAALGSLCYNSDLGAVAKMNILCNRLGMDTISTGSVLAFATECFERGLLTPEDNGGVGLAWGEPEAYLTLIEKIAHREGLGALLAEGVRRAAGRLGRGAEEWAVEVKGLETAMHEPRGAWSLGVSYATISRGGCHTAFTPRIDAFGGTYPEIGIEGKFDRFSVKGKALIAKEIQDWKCIIDSLVVCNLAYSRMGEGPGLVAKFYSAATGIERDARGLQRVGERIFNLKRLYNLREGMPPTEDRLPKRFTHQAHTKGPCIGQKVDLEPMLQEYYGLRGWTSEGTPTPAKLKELSLA